jgi:putative toxin-antitoxin system antitoxin component (TIGR02293 family)
MSAVRPGDLAALLGVRLKKPREFTSLDLAEAVAHGLSVKAVDGLCVRIAPGDATFRYRIVPKATLMRRQRSAERRLTSGESDRLARLARIWAFAAEVWGSDAAAQRFLAEPHPLLRGRAPRDVAAETEIGARTVEELLGRLRFGSAA